MLFFAGIAIFAARSAADAWALWMLWGWFVAPLAGVRITYVHAMGLDLVVGFLLACALTRPRGETDTAADLSFSAAKLIIAPLVVGAGWIIQGFM